MCANPCDVTTVCVLVALIAAAAFSFCTRLQIKQLLHIRLHSYCKQLMQDCMCVCMGCYLCIRCFHNGFVFNFWLSSRSQPTADGGVMENSLWWVWTAKSLGSGEQIRGKFIVPFGWDAHSCAPRLWIIQPRWSHHYLVCHAPLPIPEKWSLCIV